MNYYADHQIKENISNQKAKNHSVAFFERGSWYHRFKDFDENGNTKYGKKGGFNTKKEAEESYWKCLKEYENVNLMNESYSAESILFGDYLKQWFETDFSKKIQSTTRMVTAHIIYNVIIPNICNDLKLSLVNVDYLNTLLSECAKASPSAGNKTREVLSIAFKNALINGYIKSNPLPDTKLYKRKKPNVKVYNKEEIKKFLIYAKESTWYLEILLALFCGLRKGEILGLKFRDFDIDNQTVKVTRQLVSNPILSENSSKILRTELVERNPKTPNSIRRLKIPSIVFDELFIRKNEIEKNKSLYGTDYCDFDYITCQKNGNPHSMCAFNIALSKICKKASLPKVTVHGLRHTYATILIENGASLSKISALLGHSSINTTFEYYCDVSDEINNIKAFIDDMFIPGGDV